MTQNISNIALYQNEDTPFLRDLIAACATNNLYKVKNLCTNEKAIKSLDLFSLSRMLMHISDVSVLSFLEQKNLFSYKNPNALIRELFLTSNHNNEKIMAWLMPFHAFQKELNNHRLYTVEMIKNNVNVFFVIMDFMKSQKPSIFFQVLQNFLKKIIEEENKDQFLFEEIYFKYKKDIRVGVLDKLFYLSIVKENFLIARFFVEQNLTTTDKLQKIVYKKQNKVWTRRQFDFFVEQNINLTQNDFQLIMEYIDRPLRPSGIHTHFLQEYILENHTELIDAVINKISEFSSYQRKTALKEYLKVKMIIDLDRSLIQKETIKRLKV